LFYASKPWLEGLVLPKFVLHKVKGNKPYLHPSDIVKVRFSSLNYKTVWFFPSRIVLDGGFTHVALKERQNILFLIKSQKCTFRESKNYKIFSCYGIVYTISFYFVRTYIDIFF
jgi:hypothetical protein